MPILMKRPTPSAAGKRNFWMPSVRKIQPTRRRNSRAAQAWLAGMSSRRVIIISWLHLHVAEQAHETVVHMQLLMAMEEGRPGVAGNEVHLYLLVAADHNNILHDAGGRLAGDPPELKAVAMQMNGMDIVPGVAHAQAVATTLSQVEGRGRHHLIRRIGDAIDRP